MTEQPPPPPQPKRKRPWYLRWWAWLIAAVLVIFVLFIVLAAIVGAQVVAEAPTPTPTATQTAAPTVKPAPTAKPTPSASTPSTPSASATPTTKPKPKPKPAPTSTTIGEPPVEVDGPLSYTVWSTIEGAFMDGVTTSSPLYPVTKVEDITSNTVRVYVQENLSTDDKATVGRQIFTLGAWDNTDLQTVVVRDASGVDSNYYRSSIPGIDQ